MLVFSPDGSSYEARALHDNVSSASFMSERLAQTLRLPRVTQNVHMSGIADVSPKFPVKSIANFQISAAYIEEGTIYLYTQFPYS